MFTGNANDPGSFVFFGMLEEKSGLGEIMRLGLNYQKPHAINRSHGRFFEISRLIYSIHSPAKLISTLIKMQTFDSFCIEAIS